MADGVLRVRLLDPRATMPIPASGGAAGYELSFVGDEEQQLSPGERRLFGTKLCLSFDEHYYGQIAPRESLALQGLDAVADVINANYGGEVTVLLHNASSDIATVRPGDRIAQIIFHRVGQFSVSVDEQLPESPRDDVESR